MLRFGESGGFFLQKLGLCLVPQNGSKVLRFFSSCC
jgi:hypothetical protein